MIGRDEVVEGVDGSSDESARGLQPKSKKLDAEGETLPTYEVQ